jgi:hypothetical protein
MRGIERWGQNCTEDGFATSGFNGLTISRLLA